MELLFNPNKPHFSTWLELYNVNPLPNNDFKFFNHDERSNGTPLYYAALWGLHDLTEHLIVKHLQDVNAHGGFNVTPLGAALAGKHLQLAELLFRHGATLDVQASHRRLTLLHAASERGDPEILQWLLNHGLDPSFDGGLGTTPLHWAAMYGKLEATRILLQHNADVKAQGIRGMTSLHHASDFGYPDVAQLLLGHGADVNARDLDGSTPLHRASRSVIQQREGLLAVARLLLEHGADRSAVDNEGKTAFRVVENDDEEMMQLLSELIAH